MPYQKEYLLNFAPISWERPGLKHKRFYDKQSLEKLATGLHLSQQHGEDKKFTCPVHVEVTFALPFPKSKEQRVKFEPWCPNFPDIDNLQKFLFDTITQTGCIWEDDRLIVSLLCKKIYGKNPSTHLLIKEIEI